MRNPYEDEQDLEMFAVCEYCENRVEDSLGDIGCKLTGSHIEQPKRIIECGGFELETAWLDEYNEMFDTFEE